MNIMVVSDTHGDANEVIKQYKKLKDIEMLIHLGDYERDVLKIKESVSCKVISIKGNTDGAYNEDTHKIIEINKHRLLLTHGHMEKVKLGLSTLYYKTISLSCDIVLFGHTHIPICIHEKDVVMMNPGSLTLPKGGSKPSFGMLTLEGHSIFAKIISLKEQPKA